MPAVLSVITFMIVVSAAAFLFAFVVMPNVNPGRMTSTEKWYKAAVPRWNMFTAEEGLPTGE